VRVLRGGLRFNQHVSYLDRKKIGKLVIW